MNEHPSWRVEEGHWLTNLGILVVWCNIQQQKQEF